MGSGLVEREVDLVIDRRVKKRSMHCRRDNAKAVVALHTCRFNRDWDQVLAARPAA